MDGCSKAGARGGLHSYTRTCSRLTPELDARAQLITIIQVCRLTGTLCPGLQVACGLALGVVLMALAVCFRRELFGAAGAGMLSAACLAATKTMSACPCLHLGWRACADTCSNGRAAAACQRRSHEIVCAMHGCAWGRPLHGEPLGRLVPAVHACSAHTSFATAEHTLPPHTATTHSQPLWMRQWRKASKTSAGS